MNNKGVTLIELLIVIVVIGIISAFAVPAVSGYLDRAKQQAVYQDAIAVRDAAKYYCNQVDVTCASDETLEYSDLSDYLDSFDATKYDTDAGTVLATRSGNGWLVALEAAGANSGNYEWASNDPATTSVADGVVVDDND